MNFPRLALAAVAAWACDVVFVSLVYDWFLADLIAERPGVFRRRDEWPLGFGFGARLVGFFAFAYMYAKGYEGGDGPQEGLRFGTLVGLMLVCLAGIREYAVINLAPAFGVYAAVAALVELSLMGTIVGAVYRPVAGVPGARPRPRGAGGRA